MVVAGSLALSISSSFICCCCWIASGSGWFFNPEYDACAVPPFSAVQCWFVWFATAVCRLDRTEIK